MNPSDLFTMITTVWNMTQLVRVALGVLRSGRGRHRRPRR